MKYRIVALFILYSLFFILGGCKVGRQSQSEYRTAEIHTSHRNDSTHVQRMIRRLKNRQAEIKHVEFSPPDSCGKQAIRSISSITVKEEVTAGDSLVIDAGTETLASDREDTSLKEKTKWEGKVLYPLAILFIGCVLCIGVFLYL